jgi:integrase
LATKAEKLKSGNYRVRVSYVDETGKQRFKSFTAPSPKEAKYLASKYENERQYKSKPENISVQNMLTNFIENRKNILSPSTIVGYKQLSRNAYKSIIDVRLGALKKEDIQKAINEYAKTHSPKTIRNAITFLSSAVKEMGLDIDMNIDIPKSRKPDIIIPTTEQVNLIASNTKDTNLYIPFLLAATMGMRRSEIFALTWDDIDLENNLIHINKAMVLNEHKQYIIKSQTKTTTSKRKLSMPDIVINELVKLDKTKSLIQIKIDQFHYKYRSLCKKINVPKSFHALRHYNASIMLQLNVPNKYAMERMGHSTDDMLKKVYQHTFKSEQDIITDKINTFIEEKLIFPKK